MTSLHSIRSARTLALLALPVEHWPSGTVHTPDDVLLDGMSLAAAAAAAPTPAVRIGARAGGRAGTPALLPGPDAHIDRGHITVVLTRVEQISRPGHSRHPEVWVDAELGNCHPLLAAVRVIGRVPTGRRQRVELRPVRAGLSARLRLPADLAPGDLLAVPCAGATPLSDVRRRDHHLERLSEERLGEERLNQKRLSDERFPSDDDLPFAPHCWR